MTQPGQPTDQKPINLAQLQDELATAGVDVSAGLGLSETPGLVFTYADGQLVDFPAEQIDTVNLVIAAHLAMREKTDEEYAIEFQSDSTNAARRTEINNIMSGLLPREQVPL